jgi:hypothetical protein
MSTLSEQHNVQGYGLGGQSTRGVVQSVINCTAQTDILIQDLVIASSLPRGLVTDIRVAGQSVIVGTGALDLESFQPNGVPGDDGARSLGIALEQNQVLSVSTTLDLAATCAVFAGCDPINPEQVVPINYADLNYAAGLGSNNIPANSTTSFSTTINRATVLGRLCLSISDGAGGAFPGVIGDVCVTSLAINNIEILSGSSGSAGEIPIEALLATSTMTEELIMGFYCPPNSTLTVTVRNYDLAAAVTVRGTVFCLPL